MYVLADACITTKMFTTIKIGNTTDQNPESYDVNWIVYDNDWTCWLDGLIPVPVSKDSLVYERYSDGFIKIPSVLKVNSSFMDVSRFREVLEVKLS